MKPGNYWIKNKPWSPWEIARHEEDGCWIAFGGRLPPPAVVGDFIPQKKEDYEVEERSVWLEMAEYALYGAGAGVIVWSLVDVYRAWRSGIEFDRRMADLDRANTCNPTAAKPSRPQCSPRAGADDVDHSAEDCPFNPPDDDQKH